MYFNIEAKHSASPSIGTVHTYTHYASCFSWLYGLCRSMSITLRSWYK